MREQRAVALAEVDLAFQAGTLQWDTVDNVVHGFPTRGTLGEYVEGQDDEGEAAEGKAWSDRGSLSSGNMSEEQVKIHDVCAGGDPRVLTEPQAVKVVEVAERLRQSGQHARAGQRN